MVVSWIGPRVLLVFCSILCFFGYRHIIREAARKRDNQYAVEKGCKPLRRWAARWPLGLDLLVQASRHARAETILQFFLEIIDSSGTTHEQQLLGSRGINTIEPRNIEAVLSNQFEDFDLGLRPVHFAPLLGKGIFTQDGADWKHSRELLRPQFMSNRYQNFEEIKTSVESLIRKVPKDGHVDLQPLFFQLTFDTTTFLLFGEKMSSLESSEVASKETEFANAFNTGQDFLSHRGRLGDFYWVTNPIPAFRRACKASHSFVDMAVQRALDATDQSKQASHSENKRYVFIDALIQETRSKKVLRDQCLNVLLAGRDTTACCLTWTLRLLARHQHVLVKLRAEVATISGLGHNASQPTREHLKKMPYLALVLKEVLRLYPSVPVNSRAALKTTTLPLGGGPDGQSPILVRKGEAVGYCVYAMHRRTDIYGPDALEFVPERWENGKLKDVGFGYLPFNGGPRVCLGQDFALLEAGYTVARLVQLFPYICVPEGDPVVEVGKEKQALTLVVAAGDGCRVHLRSGDV